MRWQTHGEVIAEDETTCPVAIRRTIAGKVDEGHCGLPLDESWVN